MRVSRPVWGTQIALEIEDPIDGACIEDLYAWFGRVDELFSTWRDDSEISRLTAGALHLDDASAEVREVLERCEAIRIETGGAFDVHAGSHPDAPPFPGRAPLDPSGLVKGWALDRGADMLAGAGAETFWL